MAIRKKKTGDGMPLDRIGGFLFEGAIVAFGVVDYKAYDQPEVIFTYKLGEYKNKVPDSITPGLVLGFIKKLGKSYVDVVFTTPDSDDKFIKRLRRPSDQLIMIEPDQLNSRVPEYEKLKLAAANARTY